MDYNISALLVYTFCKESIINSVKDIYNRKFMKVTEWEFDGIHGNQIKNKLWLGHLKSPNLGDTNVT